MGNAIISVAPIAENTFTSNARPTRIARYVASLLRSIPLAPGAKPAARDRCYSISIRGRRNTDRAAAAWELAMIWFAHIHEAILTPPISKPQSRSRGRSGA